MTTELKSFLCEQEKLKCVSPRIVLRLSDGLPNSGAEDSVNHLEALILSVRVAGRVFIGSCD